MNSILLQWKDKISPKSFLLGIALLLASLIVAIYIITRPAPALAEQIPITELLPITSKVQIAENSDNEIEKKQTIVKSRKVLHTTVRPLEIKVFSPPTVNLISPVAGSTFQTPATINYEAEVSNNQSRIEKVEFFAARTLAKGYSVCNNSRDVEVPNGKLIKIGESRQLPYIISNSALITGHYAVYAVVTDVAGVRQISQPNVIFIENFLPETNKTIIGWGNPSQNTKYQDFGTELYTHLIKPGFKWDFEALTEPVLSSPVNDCLKVEIGEPKEGAVRAGEIMTVSADIESSNSNQGITYQWNLTGGRIINGQGTNSIKIDTTGLGGIAIIATAEIKTDSGCNVRRSKELSIFSNEGGSTNINLTTSIDFGRLDRFADSLADNPGSVGYIISYGGLPKCRNEAEDLSSAAKRYLFSQRNVDRRRIITMNGGSLPEKSLRLYIVPPGGAPPELDENAQPVDPNAPICPQTRQISEEIIPIQPRPAHPYKNCPDVAEKLYFFTNFSGGLKQINFCPYNVKDPKDQTKDLKFKLLNDVKGVYGTKLKYKYYTNGGTITGEGDNAQWDLTNVRFKPGYYTVVAKIDDDCGCNIVATKSVLITNYCTPCLNAESSSSCLPSNLSHFNIAVSDENNSLLKDLSYDWELPFGEVISGQGTNSIEVLEGVNGTSLKAAVKINGIGQGRSKINLKFDSHFGRSNLTYKWNVSNGKIVAGQGTDSVEIDLTELKKDEPVVLTIEVDRLTWVNFSVEGHEWAITDTTKDKLIYKWSVDKGEIISGQGTDSISVAGYLEEGTIITATAEVHGIDDYCIDKISIKGKVVSRCGPHAQLIDNHASNISPGVGVRRAITQKQYVTTTEETILRESGQADDADNQNPENLYTSLDSPEKEYIKVNWAKEPVQISDSIVIEVVYNRVKQQLEVKNEAGVIVAEVKEPIINRWGPNYDVWGKIIVQSETLYRNNTQCSPECDTRFQPITTVTEQTWTLTLSAKEAGGHTFNLEMLIEGRNKRNNKDVMTEERAWGQSNLKVTVRNDMPTKNHLIVGAVVLGLGGFGFSIRGIKFGKINIALGRYVITGGQFGAVGDGAKAEQFTQAQNSNPELVSPDSAEDSKAEPEK